MAFNDFSGDHDDDDTAPTAPGGPPSGPMGISMGNMSKQVDDITDILINYNDRFKDASPAMFREELVELTLSVLISAKKPNPMLVGPAGVGKTRVVEDIARLIANKSTQIPRQLADNVIWELPLSNIVAGAGLVGELEKRVTAIVDYISDPKNHAILFIDEIHLLSSRDPSYNKIAQILKPALARGDMHVIGATTAQEARSIDNDPAFARRFSRLVVDELSLAQTVEIVRAATPSLVDHYRYTVGVDDAMIEQVAIIADAHSSAASHRPDNALTLLDRAMGDAVVSHGHAVTQAERDGDTDFAAVLRAMTPLPMTRQRLESVAVRLMTGLAKKKPYDADELRQALAVIKGQDDVLETLIDAVGRQSLGLFPRDKPVTWLLAGASGVGKTESVKIMARALTGQEPIMLAMSEYHTPWDASKLIGSGPGYAGSDSNKELPFDSLESNPYRVILLDELEKAHPTIQRLLLTALDEGWMRMASGKVIDFTKTIIVGTTNAGRERFSGRATTGFSAGVQSDETMMTREEITEAIRDSFDAEFIGRFQRIVAFHPITRGVYGDIIRSQYAAERARIVRSDIHMATVLPEAIAAGEMDQLVETSFTRGQGARPALNAVREWIENTAMAAATAASAPVAETDGDIIETTVE